jgi:hypothetical protein
VGGACKGRARARGGGSAVGEGREKPCVRVCVCARTTSVAPLLLPLLLPLLFPCRVSWAERVELGGTGNGLHSEDSPPASPLPWETGSVGGGGQARETRRVAACGGVWLACGRLCRGAGNFPAHRILHAFCDQSPRGVIDSRSTKPFRIFAMGGFLHAPCLPRACGRPCSSSIIPAVRDRDRGTAAIAHRRARPFVVEHAAQKTQTLLHARCTLHTPHCTLHTAPSTRLVPQGAAHVDIAARAPSWRSQWPR